LALLATESARLSAPWIEQKAHRPKLPLNGRNYIQLLTLDTNDDCGGGATSRSESSKVGGDRSSTQNYSIAGMRFTVEQLSARRIAIPTQFQHEFIFGRRSTRFRNSNLSTGIYSAQFGRRTLWPDAASQRSPERTNTTARCMSSAELRSGRQRGRNQSTGPKNPFSGQNQYRVLFGRQADSPTGCFSTPNLSGLRESLTTMAGGQRRDQRGC